MIPLGNDGDEEMMVDINTTPLVDVLLVLLVMLIITIPIQLHSVTIEMPGTTAPETVVEPDVVRIGVTPAGTYTWNDEPVPDRATLDARLQAASLMAEQPEIHIRPERTAKYEQVAAVLSSAQRMGLFKIGLVGSEQFAQ